jgi:hypothetical protein
LAGFECRSFRNGRPATNLGNFPVIREGGLEPAVFSRPGLDGLDEVGDAVRDFGSGLFVDIDDGNLCACRSESVTLAPLEWDFTVARYAVTSFILVIALVIAHKWLPGWRRRFVDILPGIVVTLALWLASSILFGRYLAEFSSTYVSYYAGLASVMIALVYLYLNAFIFVYGGEFNSAISRARNRTNGNSNEDERSG